MSRKSPTDFERRDERVRYPTTNGAFVISYKAGYPVGRFERNAPPIRYDDHQDLTYYLDSNRDRHPVRNIADWKIRRRNILQNMQLVMGALPSPTSRVPLDVGFLKKTAVGRLWRQKITYRTDPYDRVPAYLFSPQHPPAGRKLPAVLCLH